MLQLTRPAVPHDAMQHWHGVFPVHAPGSPMVGHRFECIQVQRLWIGSRLVTRVWLHTVLPRRRDLCCVIGCDISTFFLAPMEEVYPTEEA